MKDIFISPRSTIIEALKKLDQVATKVLLVVDENRKLLGTVTDGDIRRYILKIGKIEGKIEEVYFKNPIFIYENEIEKVKELMLNHSIELIPIVNNEKIVVSHKTWTDVFSDTFSKKKIKKDLKIPVVIMAGGKGTRLAPFTKILPKPLIPIGDKSIIEIIIDKFRVYGVNEFYISINHKSRIIKAYFEEIRPDYNVIFIEEEIPLGTVGALHKLNGIIQGNFFLTNCDIIIETGYKTILDYHIKKGNDITIVASIKNYIIPYGICEIQNGGKLVKIKEKPEYNFLVNTGMYILDSDILKYIPKNQFFNFDDLINKIINSHKIGIFPISENSWIDVGEWSEYKKTIDNFLKMEKL